MEESDLKKIQLFSGISKETMNALEPCLRRKAFPKGGAILWEKDPCRHIYFIISGDVEVYLLAPNGREQVLERMGMGEAFNLVPAFKHTLNNHANVRAATKVEVFEMSKDDFMDLLERLPEFSLAVADYMARRLAKMVTLVEDLSLLSVRQRIASFLIKQADTPSGRWTQEEMARRLGSVRDVVGRILRQLENEGLIRFEHHQILLVDREAMQKIALGEK
jgi:CRP/FNR family transcriptional regulator, cyclic AMP receptor protein